MMKGNGVSDGIAIAPAYVYLPEKATIQIEHILPSQTEDEISMLKAAFCRADAELTDLIQSFHESKAEQAKIFTAHREILSDEVLMDSILNLIKEDRLSAKSAIADAFGQFITLLSNSGDVNIALRTADLEDVRNRLIRCLLGGDESSLSRLPGDCILVARDLLPSETVLMDRGHVRGIVTETGGATSHTAILARSFGIPALLGVSDATTRIHSDEELLLDAQEGLLIVRPDEAERADGERKKARWMARMVDEESIKSAAGRTKDGTRIEIGLNIGSDAEDIPEYIDFIGLFRTEFLYMNSDHLPTEEEQFSAYRRVLVRAKGRPVVLRTLDIGADKALPYLRIKHEDNPALGMRALRFCFENIAIFKTQLRAALRASIFGNLWLMFPMVASIDDILRVKSILDEVTKDLRMSNIDYSPEVKIGIMIEVPSIALIADLAAKVADFASIGTNDLCQYTHAVDRMNADAAEYYQEKSTAMYRLIDMAIRGFRDAGKPISVCGELGGDPDAAVMMAGMGIRKLSMNASGIAKVKQRLSGTTLGEAQAKARDMLIYENKS